jgi:hypothetical protein
MINIIKTIINQNRRAIPFDILVSKLVEHHYVVSQFDSIPDAQSVERLVRSCNELLIFHATGHMFVKFKHPSRIIAGAVCAT